MYFIATGDCVVTVRDLQREEEEVGNLGRGNFFGVSIQFAKSFQEIALCAQSKRTASVKSKNYCVTARLDQQGFNEIIARFPDFKTKLKQHSRGYQDPMKLQLKEAISSTDYLSILPEETLDDLVYMLKQEKFDSDNVIFREGDQC